MTMADVVRCEKGGICMEMNLYIPCAGQLPQFLAGKERLINEAMRSLHEALNGQIRQPIVYYGLRGVGKTAILNEIAEQMKQYNVVFGSIEINKNTSFKDYVAELFVRAFKEMCKADVTEFDCEDLEVIQQFTTDNFNPLLLESDFVYGMKDLVLHVGEIAKKSGFCVCMIIDNIHRMKKDDLGDLLTVMHRVQQLNLPVMLIGAGLPTVLKIMANAKPYAERLFVFEPVISLEDGEQVLSQ